MWISEHRFINLILYLQSELKNPHSHLRLHFWLLFFLLLDRISCSIVMTLLLTLSHRSLLLLLLLLLFILLFSWHYFPFFSLFMNLDCKFFDITFEKFDDSVVLAMARDGCSLLLDER
mgnify:CR=1 FL=1